MSEPKIEGMELMPGFKGVAGDAGSDQTMFKGVHWGKAMMWIFLLSDTFIFSCFLISYMKGRGSTLVDWPNASEVFGLHVFGVEVPLLLHLIGLSGRGPKPVTLPPETSKTPFGAWL